MMNFHKPSNSYRHYAYSSQYLLTLTRRKEAFRKGNMHEYVGLEDVEAGTGNKHLKQYYM